MKKRIHFLWNCFCMVTTCTLTATMLFTNVLFRTDSIPPNILWQILLVSFLCTASTLLYPWERAPKKIEFRIRVIIHYIIINVIVMGFGSLFDWYRITSLASVLVMLISIAAIFIFVSAASWRHSVKDTKEMNERLEEYQNKTNQGI